MQDFFLYILKCSDGSYYIGHTDNIEQRMDQHCNGKAAGYTSSRLPVELVFLQAYETRDEAFLQERKIKKWTRDKKEALICAEFNMLKQFAKKKFE